MRYDSKSNSFVGTVENIIQKTLRNARVEVHLSNGKELGPTTPTNLKPGEIMDVELKSSSRFFLKWSVHVEVDKESDILV